MNSPKKKKRRGLLKYLSMETIPETGAALSNAPIVGSFVMPGKKFHLNHHVHDGDGLFLSQQISSRRLSESSTALDYVSDWSEDGDDDDSGISRHASFSGSFSSLESKFSA